MSLKFAINRSLLKCGVRWTGTVCVSAPISYSLYYADFLVCCWYCILQLLLTQNMLLWFSVLQGKMRDAQQIIMSMWSAGYAATDIIQTLFKVSCADVFSVPVWFLLSPRPLTGDQGPRSLGDIKAGASAGDRILAHAHRRGPQHTAAAARLYRQTSCHRSGGSGWAAFVERTHIFLSSLSLNRVLNYAWSSRTW